MNILLVGLSYKTAPIEIREQHTFSPEVLRSALTHFGANHTRGQLEDVKEGVILSTCNRLEIYALVDDPRIAQNAIINFLGHTCGAPSKSFDDYLYTCHNEEAAHHLMRVASGLDSMVLGEPQILGQITDAYEAALAQQAAGTVLSALFRAAIHAGKRARTETAIGVNSASVSSVAASLATRLLGDLSQRQVLLVGAGEMGAIAVRALQKRGVANIVVANRTFKNAARLAKAWNGRAISFQQLPQAIVESDIIITSTGAPHAILNRKLLEPAMTYRQERSLFIIDIAVPRDVDPDVLQMPNVYLHDIDDLQGLADENLHEREAQIPRVEMIVAEEMQKFLEWYASLEVVSTITTLRKQAEQLRLSELDRLFNRLDLDERERTLVMTMSHRLVNKILHQPTRCLKKEAANGNGAAFVSTTRQLFSLDDMGTPC